MQLSFICSLDAIHLLKFLKTFLQEKNVRFLSQSLPLVACSETIVIASKLHIHSLSLVYYFIIIMGPGFDASATFFKVPYRHLMVDELCVGSFNV